MFESCSRRYIFALVDGFPYFATEDPVTKDDIGLGMQKVFGL
jgi:hypothetical protein